MSKCKLLSLDTSSSCTGYAVYVDCKLKKHGALDLKRSKEPYKYRRMIKLIKELLDKEKPDIVVAELPCVHAGIQSHRLLERILGVVEDCCEDRNIYYHEEIPSHWRCLVKTSPVPKGRKEVKAWDISLVKELFGVEVGDDEADAILIGLAYIKEFA